jgi:hypothetical protein
LSDLSANEDEMIMRKMKVFLAAVAVVALVGLPALAYRIHNEAASDHQGFSANTLFGPDGKLIGAAANLSIRTQLQREGLPE